MSHATVPTKKTVSPAGIGKPTRAKRANTLPAAADATASTTFRFDLLIIRQNIRALINSISDKCTVASVLGFCLVIAAQLTLMWQPAVGIYINAAALVGLVAIALTSSKLRNLAVSLGIIPVANLVLASISNRQLDTFTNTLVYDGLVLLLATVYHLMFAKDNPAAARSKSVKQFITRAPLMIILGLVIGIIGYASLRHHYPFAGYSLPIVASAVTGFAFAEEIFFRRLVQEQATRIMHPLVAALGTAVLYITLALGQNTLLSIPVSIALAMALALTYYKTKNLVLTLILSIVTKLVYISLIASFMLR